MRMDRVSWVKVEEYLRSSPTKDTVLLAVGSLENHGKHMPLGTDTLIPDRILELIEERSEVMIAPTIPYGATDYLMGFPGTVSLGTEGLIQVLRAITDSLYRYGFRRFVILNGHGGNKKAIETVGVELHNRGAWLAEMDWWLQAGELHPEWKDGHGGGEETAGVLAVDPSLVDPQWLQEGQNLKNDATDAFPTQGFHSVYYQGASVILPREVHHDSDNGGIARLAPTQATEEWGREMLQTMADYYAAFIREFSRIPLPEPKHNAST